MMNKTEQNSMSENASKSGGHNLQGQDFTVDRIQVGSISPDELYKRMGVSNGGK